MIGYTSIVYHNGILRKSPMLSVELLLFISLGVCVVVILHGLVKIGIILPIGNISCLLLKRTMTIMIG